MKNIRTHITPALLAAALLLPTAAMADTANDNLTVTLNITASCTLKAATLAFVDQTQGFTAAVDDNTSVVVNCTATAPYTLGFNNGGHYSDGTRRMQSTTGSTNYVKYELYTSASYNTVLDNGTNTLDGIGNGLNQNLTVYGRVPGQSSAPLGSYVDTVTMTLTY